MWIGNVSIATEKELLGALKYYTEDLDEVNTRMDSIIPRYGVEAIRERQDDNEVKIRRIKTELIRRWTSHSD